MVKVTELGYLGLVVSDAEAWKDYASQCIGMEVMDEGEGDRFYLRLDNWHHRFVVHTGDRDDLAYTGWRVAGEPELHEFETLLSANGIEYRVATIEENEERRVLGHLKLKDPAGVPVEIFYGPRIDAHLPLYPGRRMHGPFRTGSAGLGHVVVASDDIRASYDFYRLLGLTGSVEYHLGSPGGVLKPVFMHCNERQHSVAFGVPSGDKLLNHLMLEYANIYDLGASHDIIRKRNIPVALQLGIHANDKALTFYSATPSGWLMELGWNGCAPEPQQAYHQFDIFGHGLEAAGIGLDVDL